MLSTSWRVLDTTLTGSKSPQLPQTLGRVREILCIIDMCCENFSWDHVNYINCGRTAFIERVEAEVKKAAGTFKIIQVPKERKGG